MTRRPRVLAAVAAAAFALAVVPPAAADNRDDLQDQITQNTSQLETLRSELEGVDVSLQETYLALQEAELQLPIAEAELAQAEEDLAAAERVAEQVADRLALAEAEQADLTTQIEDSRSQIAASQDSLGELARTTYQNGAGQSTVSLLVGSSSDDDFLTQYSAIDTAVRSQTSVLVEMEELEAATVNDEARQEAVTELIEELKAEADQAVLDAEDARVAADAKRQEIADLQASMTTLAADLEGQRVSIETQQATIEQENSDLESEIASIDEANRIAEEQRLAEERLAQQQANAAAQQQSSSSSNSGSSSSSNSSSSGSGSSSSGSSSSSGASLVPPVPQPLYVTSSYGYRVYPITGGWFMHNGVDLRSACGNSQVSSAAGTVSAVKPAYGNGTHGNQVIVNHGIINGSSYVTVYNHLSRFAVSTGDSVSQGQVIGYTGATGNVTGCHVHFEVWKNGSTIDPMTLSGF